MLVLIVLVFPLVLIVLAALAAAVSVRKSALRITPDAVEIHNAGQPPHVVPLGTVDRFDEPTPVGAFKGLRPRTSVLVLRDGTRLPVRAIAEPDAGYGVEALNARLDALRRAR